jgi:hypothetical protein
MPEGDWRKLEAYCTADLDALWDGLHELRDKAAEWDLDLGQTLGSSAVKYARRMGVEIDHGMKATTWKTARRALYGGRCEVFSRGGTGALDYDRHACYAAEMAGSLPVGKAVRRWGDEASKHFDKSTPGVYFARVNVSPYEWIPPLPLRSSEGKISYPTGCFSGWWALPELEHASEAGAEVLGISEAVTWPELGRPLRPLIEHLFELRSEQPEGSFYEAWLKLYPNSLAGKLEERPVKQVFLINPPKLGVCPAGPWDLCSSGNPETDCGKCCRWHCSETCGAYVRWSKHVWARSYWRIDDHAHVGWSAYVKGNARVELHKQLIDGGEDGDDAIYCDTDEVITFEERMRGIGTGLGQWELEHRFVDLIVSRPKGILGTGDDGMKARASGIPGFRELDTVVKQATQGVGYRPSTMRGFKEGARRGLFFEKEHRVFKLGESAGSRVWDGPTSTRPPHVGRDVRL